MATLPVLKPMCRQTLGGECRSERRSVYLAIIFLFGISPRQLSVIASRWILKVKAQDTEAAQTLQ
jgi:hypothetical protein